MNKELVTIKGVDIDLSDLDDVQAFEDIINLEVFKDIKGSEKVKAQNHLWEKLQTYRLVKRKADKKAKIMGVETPIHTPILPPKEEDEDAS